MRKLTFANVPPKSEKLSDGRTRVHYNVTEVQETNAVIDPETGEPTGETETHTVYQCEFVIIDGADHVSVSGNKITAVSDGTAHLMYRLLTSVTPGTAPTPETEFALYSQVITINVNSTAEEESDLPKPPVEKNSFFSNPGSVIAACAALALILIAAGVMIGVAVKKRKNK